MYTWLLRAPSARLVLCVPFLLAPTPAIAGALENACITVHPGPAVPDSKSCLPTNTGVSTDLWNYDTNWPEITAGAASRIYVIVAQADVPVRSISIGIEYGDLAVQWDSCADGPESPNNGWPASGSGNRITWDTCPPPEGASVITGSGYQVVFGSFYVYTYGVDTLFRIVENPGLSPPEITVGDCNMIETPRSLLRVGIVGYGDIIGYLCADLPVTPATWGGVKSMYGEEQEGRNP